MRLKEYIKQAAQSFFIVVTLINAAMMVLGEMFYPAQVLNYRMFAYPIVYGFCSMIPVLILYSPKELTVKQLLVRKLIQLLFIVLLLLFFIFGLDGLCMENAEKIAGVSASIVVIFVLEEAISWLVNTRNAELLTESLHQYQDRQL